MEHLKLIRCFFTGLDSTYNDVGWLKKPNFILTFCLAFSRNHVLLMI